MALSETGSFAYTEVERPIGIRPIYCNIRVYKRLLVNATYIVLFLLWFVVQLLTLHQNSLTCNFEHYYSRTLHQPGVRPFIVTYVRGVEEGIFQQGNACLHTGLLIREVLSRPFRFSGEIVA